MKDLKTHELPAVHGGTQATATSSALVAPYPVPPSATGQPDGDDVPPVLPDKTLQR